MKASEIKIGGLYVAKVSGKLVTVRVDKIGLNYHWMPGAQTVYEVTNLATNRKTTFRSSQRFWGVAK